MDHLPELVHHSVPKKRVGTQGWDRHVTQGTNAWTSISWSNHGDSSGSQHTHVASNFIFFFFNQTTAYLFFLSPLFIKGTTSDVWCLHMQSIYQGQSQSWYVLEAQCRNSHNILSTSHNNSTERARSQMFDKVQSFCSWFSLKLHRQNLHVKVHGCWGISENTQRTHRKDTQGAAAQQVFSGGKTDLAAVYPHLLPVPALAPQLAAPQMCRYNHVWGWTIKHNRKMNQGGGKTKQKNPHAPNNPTSFETLLFLFTPSFLSPRTRTSVLILLSSTEMIQWIICPNTRLHKSPVIYDLKVATQNKTSKKL